MSSEKHAEAKEIGQQVGNLYAFAKGLFQKIYSCVLLSRNIKNRMDDLLTGLNAKLPPQRQFSVQQIQMLMREMEAHQIEADMFFGHLMGKCLELCHQLGLRIEDKTEYRLVPVNVSRLFPSQSLVQWFESPDIKGLSVDEIKEENKILRVQFSNAKTAMESALRQLDQMKAADEEIIQYIKALEEETAKQRACLDELSTSQAQLEERCREATASLRDQNSDLEQRESTIASFEERIRNYESHIEQLNENIQTLTQSLSGQSPEQVEESILKMCGENHQRIQKQAALIETLLKSLQNMKAEKVESTHAIAGITKERDELIDKNVMLRKELESYQKTFASQKLKIAHLNTAMSQLNEQLKRSQNDLLKLKNERMDLLDQNRKTEKEYKEAVVLTKRLDNQIVRESQKASRMEERIESLMDKERALRQTAVTLKSDIEVLRQEKQKLVKIISHQEESEKTPDQQVQAAEARMKNLEARLEEGKEQHRSLLKSFGEQKKINEDLEKEIRRLKVRLQRSEQYVKNIKGA